MANNYYLIDSHSHPQFPQYDNDRDEVLKNSLEKAIGLICVGTDFEKSQKAVALANAYDLYASVGLHPNDNEIEDFDSKKYLDLSKDKKVVAIGETGLDYYRTKGEDALAKQKRGLLEHIRLSRETGLPLIIHCRDAHSDMIDLLKQEKDLKGVIHSFTGTLEDAKNYVELGFYVGLNGIITFARDYDEAVRAIPIEKILLETDAPFLTPVPHRGKRNEPAYVEHVCQKLAEIKNIQHSYVATQTVENTKKLFGI